MHFIGIDLAWKAEPPWERETGICILNADCEVVDIFLVSSNEEILEVLTGHDRLSVGIDAPLVVPDREGLRRCERELFDRGIHVLPTNRDFMNRKFGGCRGESLNQSLLERGFTLPGSDPGTKRLYEVYPYGALSVLTGGEVPRYKKGPADEKRRKTLDVLDIICEWVSVDIPPSLRDEVVSAAPAQLTGTIDKLDALLSVLCVYTHWIYDGKRTELVGDEQDGFILLPHDEVDL